MQIINEEERLVNNHRSYSTDGVAWILQGTAFPVKGHQVPTQCPGASIQGLNRSLKFIPIHSIINGIHFAKGLTHFTRKNIFL